MLQIDKLAYSPREVAKLLGLHYNTVYKIIRNGELPAKKAGARLIISRAALEKWLEEINPAGAGGGK